MYLIKGSADRREHARPVVATIGNFDGVHRGHQHVIEKLAQAGNTLDLPLVVILFEPQPREYFAPQTAPPRLTSLREKLACFRRLPVDAVLLLRFNHVLANLSATAFIEEILTGRLQVRHLVVGDDFRFGRKRQGDFTLLQQQGRIHGFEVLDTPSLTSQGERVSSTGVRLALQNGDLERAGQLLGRPYSLLGRVVHGEKRGRVLGFPTANISLGRRNSAIRGVFAVTMRLLNGENWRGVANVGQRPTIRGGEKISLETHLFDFSGDLYGQAVEVIFHQKLRDECHFANLAELSAQISRDADEARDYFARTLEADGDSRQVNREICLLR